VRCAAQSGVHTDSQELRAAPAAPPIKTRRRAQNAAVADNAINQSINLLKAKGPTGHWHRSEIHDMQ